MEEYIYNNSNRLWYENCAEIITLPVWFSQMQKNARLVSGVGNTWITSRDTTRYCTPIWFSTVSCTVI